MEIITAEILSAEMFSPRFIVKVISDPIILIEFAGALLFATYLLSNLRRELALSISSGSLLASRLFNSGAVNLAGHTASSYDVLQSETIQITGATNKRGGLFARESIPSASQYSRVPVMNRRTSVGVGGAISEPKNSLQCQAGRIHFEGALRSRRYGRVAISA